MTNLPCDNCICSTCANNDCEKCDFDCEVVKSCEAYEPYEDAYEEFISSL